MITHHNICSILGSIFESLPDLLDWDIQEIGLESLVIKFLLLQLKLVYTKILKWVIIE